MNAIPLLRLLLEATRRGKIKWHKSRGDPDLYEADLGGETLRVHFVRFVRLDGQTSDRHLAELTTFGVSTDHAVGTEGMDLINQMLAFCDLEWSGLRNRIRQRLAEAEEVMHALLEPSPAVLPSRRRTAEKATRRRRS